MAPKQTLLEFANLISCGSNGLPMQPEKVRDLSVIDLDGTSLLVVACDSDGGIGPKELDTIYCAGHVLGRFAARVPLLEVLASGARPFLLVNCLAVEMDPTGKEIIGGIQQEASEAGLDPGSAITGSTEDNVATRQTGVGVVVLGIASKQAFRPNRSRAADLVYRVGVPKSAPRHQVFPHDPQIMDVTALREICQYEYIHDILPVGSKGIEYEARQLAMSSNLAFEKAGDPEIEWRASAGPATCVLVSIDPRGASDFEKRVPKPSLRIGTLR